MTPHDNFLKKSWKVVVIMSNDFAKSEWCQWEVDIVQERRRRLKIETGGLPIGFLRLSIAAFQKMSSPTPCGYFKCGVESNNVRRGLVIYLDKTIAVVYHISLKATCITFLSILIV
jgi:hypothetical protein